MAFPRNGVAVMTEESHAGRAYNFVSSLYSPNLLAKLCVACTPPNKATSYPKLNAQQAIYLPPRSVNDEAGHWRGSPQHDEDEHSIEMLQALAKRLARWPGLCD